MIFARRIPATRLAHCFKTLWHRLYTILDCSFTNCAPCVAQRIFDTLGHLVYSTLPRFNVWIKLVKRFFE